METFPKYQMRTESQDRETHRGWGGEDGGVGDKSTEDRALAAVVQRRWRGMSWLAIPGQLTISTEPLWWVRSTVWREDHRSVNQHLTSDPDSASCESVSSNGFTRRLRRTWVNQEESVTHLGRVQRNHLLYGLKSLQNHTSSSRLL